MSGMSETRTHTHMHFILRPLRLEIHSLFLLASHYPRHCPPHFQNTIRTTSVLEANPPHRLDSGSESETRSRRGLP